MPLTAARPPVYYEDRGSGEPVLAITGFGLSSSGFDPLVHAGEHLLRWITYDHPGTGRSSGRKLPSTTAQLAESATRVLDHLQLDSASVLGISLGGAVALELALLHPTRVRSLILLSTSADGPLRRGVDLRRLASAAARTAAGSYKRRRLWFAPMLFSDEYLARGPGRAGYRAERAPDNPPDLMALLGQACAASLHSRARDLHRIQAPTLIMHGDADALVPVGNARRLARGIPGSELRLIHGGSHAFAMEHAADTATVIANWLHRRTTGAMPPP